MPGAMGVTTYYLVEIRRWANKGMGVTRQQ